MLHAILLVLLSVVLLVVGSYQGLIPSLVVGDPDVLRDVFVKDFKSFVNKSVHDDALQMYMESKMQQNGKGGQALSESAINDIAAQCMCLFIAGSDSIALTVTCAAYQLALHPEIQEEVIKEVDGAEEPTYDALRSMVLLDAVVSETLRLYSPTSV
ncbi:hypothetical protein HPB48_011695 [Haemaphysalis longicornis]|uniref:Cytochrome P450 n=1 Tax=Haemaphysalis longicornis TaxID=44386 RepID=A0A9J6GS70_HAELO|nr:hypothetical protein HPB48_011695 [Haemaphysalis longicornis]